MKTNYENDAEYSHKFHAKRNAFRASTREEKTAANKKIRQMRQAESAECPYCLQSFNPSKMQVDHIVPFANGGRHTPENVTLACANCNMGKNCRTVGVDFFPLAERRTIGRATSSLTFDGWKPEQMEKHVGRPRGSTLDAAELVAKHPDIARQLRAGHSIRHAAAITGKSTGTVQAVKRAMQKQS
jgi:hypothetical protein